MPAPHFVIPSPNPGQIIGRVQLLADIHTALRDEKPVALVHGIGGIGKTTAAAAYTRHPDYAPDYAAVCWLEVTRKLPEALALATPLHEYLGVEKAVEQTLTTPVPNPGDNIMQLAMVHVVDGLRKCPHRLLLVIDNANDEAELNQLIPALFGAQLRVLVTSRADCHDLNPIPVEALPPEEAAQLFRLHFGGAPAPGTPEDPDVFDLLASFGYHTLLAEMLGKIGKTAQYTLPKLLEFVRTLTLREEKWQIPVGTGLSGRTHRMPKQTLKTYLAHLFREIKDLTESDTSLLRKITALPNHRHNTEQLAAFLKLEGDAIFDLNRQLASLDQRGIPLRDESGGWQLHPLFREVCLDQLQPFTSENLAPMVDVVGDMVQILSTTKDWKTPMDDRIYGETLLAVLGAERSGAVSRLQNELALNYKFTGEYPAAKKMVKQALEMALEVYGDKHETVAISRSNLALVLQRMGDLKDAKTLMELALKSDLENFGDKHFKIAIRRSNLATVLQDLGDLEGAKKMLEKALVSDLENFGDKHPKVAIRHSILGLLLQDLGDLEGAKTLMEQALESGLESFGEKHPTVAIYRSNLGMVLRRLGDLKGAKTMLEQALESDLESFGEKHPKVAIYRSNLALVLQGLGDLEGAKRLLEQALASDLESLGEKHPNVAGSKNNLAFVLDDLGEKNQAIQLWQEALAIIKTALPEGHPHIKIVENALRKRGIG